MNKFSLHLLKVFLQTICVQRPFEYSVQYRVTNPLLITGIIDWPDGHTYLNTLPGPAKGQITAL